MLLDDTLSISSINSFGQNHLTTLFDQNGSALFTDYNMFLDLSVSEKFIGSELQLLINHGENVVLRVNQILGKYAEALIVRMCNLHPEINSYFAHIARFATRLNHTYIDRFVAVGTDLTSSLENPFMKFHMQVNDQQRDIIWVNKRDVIQLLTVPNKPGFVADLQVKCYHNWHDLRYAIKKYHMPIVYFDMNDDYCFLKSFWDHKKLDANSDWASVELVEPSEILADMKQRLKFYKTILLRLLNQEISVQYVIDRAKYEGDIEFGRAISGTSTINSGQIIIPSSAIKESLLILANHAHE